jgi:NDP-sugar pyrophosphorylase family protein
MSEKIQLVIPMAGEGQRFRRAGYDTPKPLINVRGIRMFELVISNLYSSSLSQIVLIVRKEFGLEAYGDEIQKSLGLPVSLVFVEETTSGPAKSVLLAKALLRADEPVVVANSDQYVNFDPDSFYATLIDGKASGAVLTMEDNDSKWSYAEINMENEVLRIVEKEVVSTHATVGIYGFRRASEMIEAIELMEQAGDMVNNEYYLGPSYNYLRRISGPVVAINLGPIGDVMHGLGVPEDLEHFLTTSFSNIAVGKAISLLSKK